MRFNPPKKITNAVLLISAFVIVSLILWNTNSFFKKFKEEERHKMEIWATAQSELLSSPEDQELGNIYLKVFQNNTSTPMILVDADGSYKLHNLPDLDPADTLGIRQKIRRFSSENSPLEISYQEELLATLYYGNSEVLNKLKFYPIALLLIIFLFGAVIFFFFKTNKASEQNRLWAGMAKETAHQIGTPLTSLLGWNELLKEKSLTPEITDEIEKDIIRLQTITERFSQIGSKPKLEVADIVAETRDAYEYLQARNSKLVRFSFTPGAASVPVMLNPSLYQWTIENLVNNGIDAMKGKGEIAIEVIPENSWVNILVSDTGSGMPKNQWHRIFEPGITTKKRGWGLGLSLVRRIVEDYHQGKIKVLSSGKEGTIMQLSLQMHK
ncbi:Histidine kinase-, DNA gyrase B-, and HSP90-like ATPase [Robiginitalea myxolifaciens]|uniref:histidine kinase n=1 Tax=Robiginitalea myxolifaciens TaxID=400055 RepID=A0A1I6G837_9FLAO|nr:ATP-binding protein [Robiginitalea myxolifaciens]SFR38366.1 Histidine kinase-, DNA gyrase B-, and HSP90-like ATPase [Robiginitalea myxolifaciens]